MKKIICLVGPSGIGKSSYIKRLQSHYNLTTPIIFTTRNPRKDDTSRYRYITKNKFQKMIRNNQFIEWDKYNGHYYGTGWKSIELLEHSKHAGVILDLTPQGCIQVKTLLNNAKIIALLPDNPSWLEQRLRERGNDSIEEIERRSKIIDRFIREVRDLKVPIVYCCYDPSSWDRTFAEITNLIEEEAK